MVDFGRRFVYHGVDNRLFGRLFRAFPQSEFRFRPVAGSDRRQVAGGVGLVIIVANQLVTPLTYIPVIIIMCREVLVSGLREFLAEFHVGMPVTKLAKWKTGFQMTAIAMILLQQLPLIGSQVNVIGEWLLWIAGILTFITGYQYFDKCQDYIYTVENNRKNPVKQVEQEVKKLRSKGAQKR